MPHFTRRTEIPATPEEVRAWLDRPGAILRLTPPWHDIERVFDSESGRGNGVLLHIGSRIGLSRHVIERTQEAGRTEIAGLNLRRPFVEWKHTHRILPHDFDSRLSVLEDSVEYTLSSAGGSQALFGASAERELVRTFGYRHRVICEDISRHADAGLPPLTIAITGSTGLIGQAIIPFLTTAGHTVVRLMRTRNEADLPTGSRLERFAMWQPSTGYVQDGAFEGVDAVIHLAGEPLFTRRWSRQQRARILDSRARGTRVLAETLAALENPPGVLLTASGAAYYGDRGHDVLDEDAGPGTGFLADVCRGWEKAATPAEDAGIRVCWMRLGITLSPVGGVFGTMLPLFRAGLGGTFGRGADWVPWIAMDDLLYAILHLLSEEGIHGAFNLSAPHPVTQRRLADTLGATLSRPASMRVPKALVGLVTGAAARDALTASTRMVPEHLANSGFRFAYPHLTDALEHVLGRSAIKSHVAITA